VLYTPQDVDLAPLAAAYGWEYVRVATRAELDQASPPASSGDRSSKSPSLAERPGPIRLPAP
jgi:2-succinyl-5-enolpyruvyl-6-hydroxy-3-cyclohexene-1-carboxylate synthase